MNTAIRTSIALALVTTSAVHAEQAVQWTTADGGNGHWYLPTTQTFAHFRDASAWAQSRGAHLATLTSSEENSFAANLAPGDFLLGGYQDVASPSYSEPGGAWRWVTDEPWVFTSWMPGEPQNGGWPDLRGEHYLQWWRYEGQTSNPRWNDAGNDLTVPPWNKPWNIRAIIEWSADCNSDGIVDYGQILAGQFADTNSDGIPDDCQCATNPSLPTCCPGDLDDDATVGGADIGLLLSNWGPCGSACLYDLNNDDKVNGGDLGLLLAGWGPCSD
jgi:hypothetical protein